MFIEKKLVLDSMGIKSWKAADRHEKQGRLPQKYDLGGSLIMYRRDEIALAMEQGTIE